MEELQKKIKEYSPYLEDLFRRVYALTIFFVITFVVGFFLAAPIIKFFTKVFNFEDVVFAATSPFQLVELAMNTGIFLATILSVPFFLYHFYAFVGSGLHRGEKKFFFLMIPVSLLLFAAGFAYCFFILYFAMQTLANINTGLGVTNLWDISTFLSQIISTSALLGLIFEFPIIVTILVQHNVINVNFLKKKRRYAIFGMFLFTALLPPTDGISLVMMVVPLAVMYEATIMYNMLSYRRPAIITK